ncbi:G2 and S phase-expressed protein 1 isoform X2 [Rhinatrema bivittatum]|uniref:G2 and S phase-expressed protein 1 isoform X2 n=1 Tax=Rhinatrema bivittatum TaxID=194408 RepID=UPI00112A251A|nr:G2 and S phase-expressed protein 1 isoform X2 [Rhinatrema bivittatum]
MDSSSADFTLLTDEKFDFDLSLTPKSEEEDEVFFGPVGHKEKCVAVGIEIQSCETEEMASPKQSAQTLWSPLSGEKFVEIFKEAHLLAAQLGCNSSKEQSKMNKSGAKSQAVEEFVQLSKAKLNIFRPEDSCNWSTPSKRETFFVPGGPTPSKRETYCVADSPFSQLPPSIQQCLKLQRTDTDACVARNTRSPALVQKTPKNTSPSPLVQKQKTKSLSEKRTVSKLQHTQAAPIPGSSQQLAKSAAETKMKTLRKRHASSVGFSEDVFCEKSSIASVSNSSFTTSKRVLPAPSKVGLNTQLKPPSNVPARRNTSSSSSSSSSSLSSMNSSLSVSPGGGNSKSSSTLNTSVSSCRLPSSTSRLDTVGQNVRLSSLSSNSSSKYSQLVKPLKTSTAVKATKPASVSTLQIQTPADSVHRQSSFPGLQSKRESAGKGTACSKPKALTVPTPKGQLKAPKRAGASSPENPIQKIMQPKRLLSCSSPGSGIVASTPIKPPSRGELQTPVLSAKSILMNSSAKRASALPTPLNRRGSGIPAVTPKSLPRVWSSPQLMLPRQASNMSTSKKSVVGSEQTKETKSQIAYNPTLFFDENAAPLLAPFTLNFSPEAKETKSEVWKEATASQPDELIDLSSPLINLSPEASKENLEVDSPLLKF